MNLHFQHWYSSAGSQKSLVSPSTNSWALSQKAFSLCGLVISTKQSLFFSDHCVLSLISPFFFFFKYKHYCVLNLHKCYCYCFTSRMTQVCVHLYRYQRKYFLYSLKSFFPLRSCSQPYTLYYTKLSMSVIIRHFDF